MDSEETIGYYRMGKIKGKIRDSGTFKELNYF
jgi:hypothetical protein